MAHTEIDRHEENHDEHEGHHIVPIPYYIGVFAILMVGTFATYAVAFYDLDGVFPGANTLVALLIAFFKMTAVVLIFMHVRWSSKLIWMTAVSGFFWLAIMFAFTMQDYFTRSMGTF